MRRNCTLFYPLKIFTSSLKYFVNILFIGNLSNLVFTTQSFQITKNKGTDTYDSSTTKMKGKI
jgi:hypothetical protein